MICGVGLILVTARAAPWVMSVIGGHQFRGAGAVLRIQVAALMFIGLSQIWGATLIALHRQRDLIVTNGAALLGVAIFAAVLVPASGAEGGAVATVAGDALLAGLILWRLYRRTDRVRLHARMLGKLALATAVALVPLLISGLPDLVAAGLSGVLYVVVAQLIGLLPKEVPEALLRRRRAVAD